MSYHKRLSVAAWLCVVSAVIALPSAILLIASRRYPGLTCWSALLSAAGIIMYVYIWLTFKRFLNLKARFYAGNVFIDILIWTNILVMAFHLFSLPFADFHKALLVPLLPLGIASGVITIILGIKLQNCEDPLFGYRKALSNLLITIGGLIATVILAPVAVLVAVVFDIVLASLFFTGAKAARETGQP